MRPDLLSLDVGPVLRGLDLAGMAVFAASGALMAARKRLDVIAAGFFALVTAVGGGTMRDLLIGAPVFWMHDAVPILLCLMVAAVGWAIPLRWWPACPRSCCATSSM